MKRLLPFILSMALLLSLSLPLSSCSDKEYKMSFFALDTLIEVTVPPLDSGEDGDLVPFIKGELSRYEEIFSATRESSELYKLNHSTERTVSVSDELFFVLCEAQKIAEKTDGAYDYTCGALTNLWKITDESAPIPTDTQIEEALSLVGYERVVLENNTVDRPVGMQFDLGGAAKGYIAEKLTESLRDAGCEWGILSLGGNISVFGDRGEPYSIGVKNPSEPSQIHGKLSLYEGYVSVSGTYERNKTVDGVTYHHIFNAKTGRCADSDILSVGVVSQDATLADALSTAFFVMGSERATEYLDSHTDIGAVIFLKNGEILTVGVEYERL